MVTNVTSSLGQGINSLSGYGLGWIATIIIFFSVLLIIFVISKNFRRFIYGGITTFILLIVYWISRWIGSQTGEGNYLPLIWFGYLVGFIIISIIIGYFLTKTKFIKNLEKKLEIEGKDGNLIG